MRQNREDKVLFCKHLYNSNLNPPSVKILTPTIGQHINGTFKIQSMAYDLDNNINNNGNWDEYSSSTRSSK